MIFKCETQLFKEARRLVPEKTSSLANTKPVNLVIVQVNHILHAPKLSKADVK